MSGSIGKVASTANYAGVSFESLLGLITASNEVMQNASKVANGYKTILTNLMTKDLESQFNQFGLTMRDQNGEMKDAFTILKELAGVYNSLGTTIDETTGETISLNDNMNKLLKDIGGAYNINILTSGFSNFDIALQATESAMNSAGSASNEYAIALDTISKKSEAMLGAFQQLVVGDGGLTEFVKLLLDAGTVLLNFANSDVGQAIINTTLFITSITLLNKGFNLTKTAISSAVKEFIAYQTALVAGSASTTAMYTSTQLLVGGLSALSKAWLTSPFGMITVAVGSVLALKTIIEQFTTSLEEQKEIVNGLSSELQTLQSEYDTLSAKDSLTDKEQERLSLLEAQIEANKTLLAQEAQKQYEQEYETVDVTSYKTITEGTKADQLNKEIDAYYKLNEQLEENKNKQLEVNTSTKEGANELNYLVEEQSDLESKIADVVNNLTSESENMQDLSDKGADLGEEYKDIIEKISDVSDNYNELNEAEEDSINTTEDTASALSVLAQELETTEEALQSQARAMGLTDDAYAGYLSNIDSIDAQMDLVSEFASQLDELTNAYQLTADAQYEYSQQGYLSVDTYSQLMQLQPQYLAMMFNEQGQLIANADATNFLYQAKVLEMGVSSARAQINLATSLANEAGAYANLGNIAIDASNGVRELVSAELELAIAQMKSQEDIDALNAKIDAIDSLTKSTMDNVAVLTSSYQPVNRNTEATKNNTSARKANTDAIDAQKEALEAYKKSLEEEAEVLESQIEDYETVIDYVKDLLKEEQEAVEEQKDKELEAIQDRIDALEEEKEKFEDNIDSKIEALEEEQEAMENNVESQIDFLEKQKEEQESYWDSQIDAIKNANEELEENIKLQQLQEALAKAKTQKVKVLKDGRFVYAEDEEAISKAEQELADYEMELAIQKQLEELEELKNQALDSLEDQIEKLEEYKQNAKNNYEQQIKDLENLKENQASIYDQQINDLQSYYNSVEAEYDLRISQYDNWLEQFEDMLDASSKRHAEILYNELVGEQGNWDARIKALGTFVQNYEAKKNQLDGVKAEINRITDQISALESKSRSSVNSLNNLSNTASGYANSVQASLDDAMAKLQRWKVVAYNKSGMGTDTYTGSYDQAYKKYKEWSETGYYQQVTIKQYANGTYSVSDDQIALVADPLSPNNREIVVGSKINRGDGILTNLKKGSGVIPAKQNLTENLVQLARWANNGLTQNAFTTNNQSSSKIINIENINLPQVKDGNDFVQYIKNNFMNDSIQFANVRV